MHYILIMMIFNGFGYQAMPIVLSEPTEQACRDDGARTGKPEMPAASTDPATWPNAGWKCDQL